MAHMDMQMAMELAMDMGMDWTAVEAEAETTGTPAVCVVCMAAAARAEEAGTTPPPECAGGCLLVGGDGPDGDAPTPAPAGEEAAVAGLVAAWDELVAEGDMDELELAQTLVEQLDGSTQGWDSSMEDAEEHPELAALVGLDPEADPETDEELAEQDEAAERWGRVVAEAARRWLAEHGPDPEQQHEAALAAADRAEAMAMELAQWGWDPRLAELEDRALELARAAEALARELEGGQPAQQPAEQTQPSSAVARRLAGILARAAEEAEEMGEAEEAGRARQLARRLEGGAATEAEWLEALGWVDPE